MSYFNTEQLDEIVMKRFVLGMTAERIAADLNCSRNVIFNVANVFDAVKNDDMEKQEKLVYQLCPPYMFEYAYKKLGKEMPDSLKEIFEQARASRNVKRKEPEKPQQEQKNEGIYLIRLLEEVQRNNELLQSLIDVVIPNYTEQLRTATMKATSIACQKFHPILEDVNTIRKELS